MDIKIWSRRIDPTLLLLLWVSCIWNCCS